MHWGFLEPGEDPFLGGARWATSTAVDLLFGDVLGPLFDDVVNPERYDYFAGGWVPVV